MGLNVVQTCTDINAENICVEYVYSGRLGDIEASIPMLEAMGLIILWIVVAICVATLFKKFS